jgi:hypothetical protein
MTADRYLRLIAGSFVLLSLALGYWVSPYWFLFTAFVGLNFVSIRLYELVSYDDHPTQSRREGIG